MYGMLPCTLLATEMVSCSRVHWAANFFTVSLDFVTEIGNIFAVVAFCSAHLEFVFAFDQPQSKSPALQPTNPANNQPTTTTNNSEQQQTTTNRTNQRGVALIEFTINFVAGSPD